MPLFRGSRWQLGGRRRSSNGWWSGSEHTYAERAFPDGSYPDGDVDDYYPPGDYYPADEAWPPAPPSARQPQAAPAHPEQPSDPRSGPSLPGPRRPPTKPAPWTNTTAWTASRPLQTLPPDPPTDPRGYPPLPASDAASLIDPVEAAALAAAFAADYLSWDETDPQRRGRVISHYLADGFADGQADPARLGWSGVGRQRAEFALPGVVRPDGDGRVTVDVRVRVTPYRPVGDISPPPDIDELEVAGVPAAAPAPTARGWKSLGSYWVRLSVAVARERGRLIIDTHDEQLGDRPPPAHGPAPLAHGPEEPGVDGDELDDDSDYPPAARAPGGGRARRTVPGGSR